MVSLLANAGVPMIALFWPVSWLALVPVIVFESWMARRHLQITWLPAVTSVGIANAISTLIGMPLCWLLWVELQFALEPLRSDNAHGLSSVGGVVYAFTVQAGWLMPYEQHLWWLVPLATLSLAIGFCLMSIGIEGGTLRLMHRTRSPKTTWRWAWRANAITYLALLVMVILFPYIDYHLTDWLRFADPVVWLMEQVGRWTFDR